MDYKKKKIYVLRHWTMWQYFFYYKNELYQQHAFVRPQWWRWLMWPFGYPLYDKNTRDEAEKVILSGAIDSIDKLKAK